MADLQLTNVINISVSQAQAGVGKLNTSNLALFTRDTPGGGFGSAGYKIYLEPTEVATDFGTGSATANMANAVFSQQPNILAGGGYLVVIPFLSSETIDAAITRTVSLVQYFGIMCAEINNSSHTLAAAAVVQALNKMFFTVSKTAADIDPAGLLDELRTGSFDKSRGLYYNGSVTDPLVMQAAYAGRALSTDFTGSNTTQTMHLKDLIGVQPDDSMTQTLLNKAQAAGADIYASIQGVPKVFTSGANKFFDRVYNREAFIAGLQVAGFNALAQVSTKIPQTEQGIDVLKGAYRGVCEQYANNQYIGPGKWNDPSTFGKQEDFLRNIAERGYYIYALPVAQQAQVDRDARLAPLIQIAIKEAGAVHKSNVIVFINA